MRIGAAMRSRTRFLKAALTAVTIAVAGSDAAATAGWITIKNDTTHTILIQEMSAIGGKPVRGKCVRLLPGETYREYQAAAGEKRVQLFNTADPSTVIAEETLTWQTQDAWYKIQSSAARTRLFEDSQIVASPKR